MERKEFLKNSIGFLGLAVATPTLLSANKKSSTSAPLSCTVTNSETAGPFPTINPANYSISNIVGDRTGIAFTININIANINASCAAYQGVIVDIWHCDKDGYYSQYGGTAMQTVNYTSNNFLRGRQVSNASGVVSFTSIFPGWYQSRATHIHVHIYNASGTSLLVTQIAFPEGTNSAVVLANAATAYGYTKGMTGYTYNASDNVFSDGVTSEMSTVTGSVSGGFTLAHTIYVAGPVLANESFNQDKFGLGQNYPNPMIDKTTIPLTLKSSAKVNVQLFDTTGRLVQNAIDSEYPSGLNEIVINRNGLSSGNYIYKVKITNSDGVFEQSKHLIIK
ncbi:T9SS type A sorting domain-containing protein [Flavobacterium sp.]|jgi:protocatechuate 3,4-dioxygenase beta subunit|uniref:T9SS type A sorting domain-containing protein n=1 Tax=Flavobacterium sp. TaxID=239 RepID=UPI003783CAA1